MRSPSAMGELLPFRQGGDNGGAPNVKRRSGSLKAHGTRLAPLDQPEKRHRAERQEGDQHGHHDQLLEEPLFLGHSGVHQLDRVRRSASPGQRGHASKVKLAETRHLAQG